MVENSVIVSAQKLYNKQCNTFALCFTHLGQSHQEWQDGESDPKLGLVECVIVGRNNNECSKEHTCTPLIAPGKFGLQIMEASLC